MAKKAEEYALFPFEESFWNLILQLRLKIVLNIVTKILSIKVN